MVDPDRLDDVKNAGVIPSNMKLRDEYACGCRQVQCDKGEEHIGADQLFPLLTYPDYRTCTVKHACPRTKISTAVRACSNKVQEDPKVFRGFKQWFRGIFKKEFLAHLDKEEIVVDLEGWLNEMPYTMAYRNQIRKAATEDRRTGDPGRYDTFCKSEMQPTPVPHHLKETVLNDTKERAIMVPTDEKKFMCNPFIHQMEGLAHRHIKEYCGRKDWNDICRILQLPYDQGKLFIAGDGSGFDMSQLRKFNKLMNELLNEAAEHYNVKFNYPLSIDDVKRVLEKALKLYVSFDHGKVTYEAEGRASGDGWTTFCNTMLMICYWRYTFNLARIEDYFLLVKGDDVLAAIYHWQLTAFQKAQKIVFTDHKDFHRHGLAQICKKIDYGNITDLDFLSNHFFLTEGGQIRMTRIPERIIQTISWSISLTKSKGDNDVREELVYNKGLSLLAWSRGLPIWEKLARKMISLGKPGRHSDYCPYVDKIRTWQDKDDRKAYMHYLENRYHMSISDVECIERAIDSINKLSGSVHIPQLSMFMM